MKLLAMPSDCDGEIPIQPAANVLIHNGTLNRLAPRSLLDELAFSHESQPLARADLGDCNAHAHPA